MVCRLYQLEPREACCRTVSTEVRAKLPAVICVFPAVQGSPRKARTPAVSGVHICADGPARSAKSPADLGRVKSGGFRRNSNGPAGWRDRDTADEPWDRDPR